MVIGISLENFRGGGLKSYGFAALGNNTTQASMSS